MLVISSPSGAGKSTLTRSLIETVTGIYLSVSVTTRQRRPSEADGVHYHFITKKKFDTMRAAGDLLESAEVHGNFYGSPRKPIERALAAGKDVLFDIDWQGAQQLYAKMRKDVVGVFVLPPTAAELKSRLERRAEDAKNVIARRLRNARNEIRHWNEYDHVIINKDFGKAFSQLKDILTAERERRAEKAGLVRLVEKLDKDLSKMTI
ncbi:MAG: guanylate kinase [Xanthobacteraceae bacterium]